ncbi:MAG: asparagine synthase (glutamine-hydrolyzing) [Myxococcales bacterium]|nr:asparagine synthase (glutamine-hydrolyzing) [Myxococcales bacterium]MCB9650247.1 asparagine synthase (glutamine-hydrolyzing) [Deltaproteobacteria bacterium]
MCGIHGIVNLVGGETPGRDLLERMGDVTVHRGPNDSGGYTADGVAIGMRRLSIIDLSGGHQPISNHDDTLWVVCNGEIYNFRELRDELMGKGHRFKTRSDSEVVLHAYAEWGDGFVEHLDGMFGFALFDKTRRRVLVGRDRLGIKPIYYLDDGQRVIFASEAKAILQVPGVERAVDPVALHQYLSLGYVPAPLCMFQGIQKLPVASMLVIEGGKATVRRYWRLPEHVDEKKTEAQWVEELLAELERSVVEQMVSDVPLGAFLSGGIDSSSIVAFMAKHSKEPVRTYAIGFDTGSAGSFYNELPFARQVAEKFKTQHREIVVRPDVVHLMPKLLWHMDEPIADSAYITTYLVSEFAKQDVTVILSGVGGDELFGGYRRYLGEFYGQLYGHIPRRLRESVIQPVARRLPADRHSTLLNISRLARGFLLSAELPRSARYESYVGVYDDAHLEALLTRMPDVPYAAIAEAFAQVPPSADDLKALFEVDLATQMPDDLLLLTDKMTMATSIECRVPLLDTRFVEMAARMPSRFKIRGRELKYILKQALKDILPHEILYRKKRGFGAPMGAWVKNELQTMTHRLLRPEQVLARGFFRPEEVLKTLELHESNKEDHTDHILALLNLEVWCRLYLDGRTPEDVSQELQSEVRA